MTVDAANELWAHGFRAIDVTDAEGCTPLLLACSPLSSGGEIICWFLEKGAAALDFNRLGIRSCLHAMAVSHQERGCSFVYERYDGPLERLNKACGPMLTDSCNCYCSSGGCLPPNLLLKRRKQENWKAKSCELNTWFDLSNIYSGDREVCCSEACRLEIFERLGMAHTCCHFD